MGNARHQLVRLFERTFSSMAFGGLFGGWLLFTVIMTFKRGLGFVLVSAGVYFAVWFAVAVVGIVLARSAGR